MSSLPANHGSANFFPLGYRGETCITCIPTPAGTFTATKPSPPFPGRRKSGLYGSQTLRASGSRLRHRLPCVASVIERRALTAGLCRHLLPPFHDLHVALAPRTATSHSQRQCRSGNTRLKFVGCDAVAISFALPCRRMYGFLWDTKRTSIINSALRVGRLRRRKHGAAANF